MLTCQLYQCYKFSLLVPLFSTDNLWSSGFIQTADYAAVDLNGQRTTQFFVFSVASAKHWTDVFELEEEFKANSKKTFLKPGSSRTYSTAYPRYTFAYSWHKPLGTVSSMTVGYEGFREAQGCGSEPV